MIGIFNATCMNLVHDKYKIVKTVTHTKSHPKFFMEYTA